MRRRGIFLCGIAALTASLETSLVRADGGFVVVVNNANDTSQLSRGELKKLCTGGTKQWRSGAAVQLGIIASEAPETQHLAGLMDFAPKELLSRIQEQVFKGEMKRPVVLRSSAECIGFARSNAGAICVASSQTPMPPEAHAVPIR